MSEQAKSLPTAEAAAEAVKAYIRMNRTKLAVDGELLSLLLPERTDIGGSRDFQRFVIDKLTAENTRLRAERDALAGHNTSSVRMGEGVRKFVLDLIDARSFSEAIHIVIAAAPAFGATKAAICVEGERDEVKSGNDGVRLIPNGTTEAVLGRDGTGAILSAGGELLLGQGAAGYKSVAVFRVKIGRHAPAALFVLGAPDERAFEDEAIATDLRFAARALERAIRAWLDLPKI
jgi:hypothetical protein